MRVRPNVAVVHKLLSFSSVASKHLHARSKSVLHITTAPVCGRLLLTCAAFHDSLSSSVVNTNFAQQQPAHTSPQGGSSNDQPEGSLPGTQQQIANTSSEHVGVPRATQIQGNSKQPGSTSVKTGPGVNRKSIKRPGSVRVKSKDGIAPGVSKHSLDWRWQILIGTL